MARVNGVEVTFDNDLARTSPPMVPMISLPRTPRRTTIQPRIASG